MQLMSMRFRGQFLKIKVLTQSSDGQEKMQESRNRVEVGRWE